MFENRSFDHMLGHSGITGTDAETGQPTAVDGLTGAESNSFHGVTFPVSRTRSTGCRAPRGAGHRGAARVRVLGHGPGLGTTRASEYDAIRARVAAIKTNEDAATYMDDVATSLAARRIATLAG
jgi:phospholipase C